MTPGDVCCFQMPSLVRPLFPQSMFFQEETSKRSWNRASRVLLNSARKSDACCRLQRRGPGFSWMGSTQRATQIEATTRQAEGSHNKPATLSDRRICNVGQRQVLGWEVPSFLAMTNELNVAQTKAEQNSLCCSYPIISKSWVPYLDLNRLQG